MKLVECKFEEIMAMKNEKVTYQPKEGDRIIEEFVSSDMNIARVEDYHYISAQSCANCFRKFIQYGHYDNVEVMQVGGQVYLLKKNVKEIFE